MSIKLAGVAFHRLRVAMVDAKLISGQRRPEHCKNLRRYRLDLAVAVTDFSYGFVWRTRVRLRKFSHRDFRIAEEYEVKHDARRN